MDVSKERLEEFKVWINEKIENKRIEVSECYDLIRGYRDDENTRTELNAVIMLSEKKMVLEWLITEYEDIYTKLRSLVMIDGYEYRDVIRFLNDMDDDEILERDDIEKISLI